MTQSLTVQVYADTDDCLAFRRVSTQAWTFGTAYGYIRAGRSYNGAQYDMWGGGMRFLNVTIPKGAAIATAVIRWTSSGSFADPGIDDYDLKSRLSGEDADNPITFSDYTDYAARVKTTATVDFDNPGEWLADAEIDSPDISTIIQEIIDRSGWVSGNAMVIFWDDHAGRTSTWNNTTYRQGQALPGTADRVAKLIVTYGASLPSEDISRVTGIRHIYKPGIFRMILSLGDVSNTIEIAEHKVRKELEIPEQQTPPPEPYPFAPEPGLVPPTPYRTGFIPPEPEPVAPEPGRPRIFPTMPGIVLPGRVAEDIFGKPSEPARKPTEILGQALRAAVPLGTMKQLWRGITPWKEEAGETFGGEVAERFRKVTQRRPGVGGIIGDIFGRLFGGKK